MPDITAEQLAARVAREKNPELFHYDDAAAIRLSWANWDRIIEALRIAAIHDGLCDRHWLAGAGFGWNAGISGDYESYIQASAIRWSQIHDASAKAAVEREVGNG